MAGTQTTDAGSAARKGAALWELLVAAALVAFGYVVIAGRTVGAIDTSQFTAAMGAPLAFIGWVAGYRPALVRPYMPWALALSLWILMSGLAAWDANSLRSGAIASFWLVFILPGLAWLLSSRLNFRGLMLGLGAGAAHFVTVAGLRLVQGNSVLDVVDDRLVGHLIGVNRNAVNMSVVFVLAFLLVGTAPLRAKLVRWPLIGVSGVWLVHSGGRSGLLGLVVVLVVMGLLQPGVGRRARALLAVLLVGTLGFTWVQTVGGQAALSTERLTDLLRGERTQSDETRELVLRKAWDLTRQHPAFGVGWGRFVETESPVADEASSSRVRRLLNTKSEHNTYAQVMSETGLPGLLFFVLMLISLLLVGVRNSHSLYARAATCALAANMFVMFFHSAFGSRLFLSMALILAMRADLVVSQPAERAPGLLGTKRIAAPSLTP